MKYGIIAQHIITTANQPESVCIFAGSVVFTLSLINLPGAGNVECDIAHVPANEELAEKHWIVWKQDVIDWKHLMFKWLGKTGDKLYFRATVSGVLLQVNGVEA